MDICCSLLGTAVQVVLHYPNEPLWNLSAKAFQDWMGCQADSDAESACFAHDVCLLDSELFHSLYAIRLSEVLDYSIVFQGVTSEECEIRHRLAQLYVVSHQG